MTPRQLTLDAQLAERRRDRGIERAATGAAQVDAEWAERMFEAVAICATALPEFICDDVWTFASAEDRAFPRPKALGAVILRAARRGWIARTDRVRLTANARRHRSPVPVWRSLIWRGGAL